MPLPRARTLAAVGVLGTASWWAADAYRLTKTYPILPPRDYHSTPGIAHAQPPEINGGVQEVVYARLKPRRDIPRPMDDYERAFFSAWTLQLEGAVFSRLGLTSARPPTADPIPETGKGGYTTEYLGGFFPVIHRDPHAVLVAFRMTASGDEPPPGGTQMVTAVAVPEGEGEGEGEVEISYASYGLAPPYPPEPAFVVPFHRWYMRYLLDRAKAKLEREWARPQATA